MEAWDIMGLHRVILGRASVSSVLYLSLPISNIYDHRINSKRSQFKEGACM